MTTPARVLSMTGYAQTEGQTGPWAWRIELKSVNGKGFDLRCRLPAGLDALETQARSLVTEAVKRGSLTLSVLAQAKGGTAGARINRSLLNEVMTLARELAPGGVTLENVLNVRGVIETDENAELNDPALLAALDAALRETVAKLVTARRTEGAHLTDILNGQLAALEGLIASARKLAADAPSTLQGKLVEQMKALLQSQPVPSDERIAQEAALLATKADVTEEIDRLVGHLAAVRGMIKEGGAVGRKLDFICQELNREANTLCSKSTSLELTGVGVDLKVVIEQLREQVQNVE